MLPLLTWDCWRLISNVGSLEFGVVQKFKVKSIGVFNCSKLDCSAANSFVVPGLRL